MEVESRAPGKIILFGEHAVVHGSAAVAASFGLYTHARIRLSSALPSFLSPESSDMISLNLLDLNVHLSSPLHALRSILDPVMLQQQNMEVTSVSDSLALLDKLEGLVDQQALPEAKIGAASGVMAFLFLYSSILGIQPSSVTISSELPLGSGLGSSASFCVALSAALLALSKGHSFHMSHQGESTGVDLSVNGWLQLDENEKGLVNKWAYEGEKIIHGRPSGIDNTVSCFGNLVKFKMGELTHLQRTFPLRVLVTNTKVGRITKALVAGVSECTSQHPRAMAAVFEAVEAITIEAIEILVSESSSVIEEEKKLEDLFQMNQGLLQCMGVSHHSIESICRTTSRYQLSSKLTGAGGGGCVLTFVPQQISVKTIDKVKKELQDQGYECFEVPIGCEGVQVAWITS